MDAEEFRKHGKAMIDYVARYLDTIHERRVTPSVEPGYLVKLIPDEAPELGEPWENIVADIEPKIMAGVSWDNQNDWNSHKKLFNGFYYSMHIRIY